MRGATRRLRREARGGRLAGLPWTSPYVSRQVHYGPGLCPVAEELHSEAFLGLNLCMCEFTPADIELVAAAFAKVWQNLHLLQEVAP